MTCDPATLPGFLSAFMDNSFDGAVMIERSIRTNRRILSCKMHATTDPGRDFPFLTQAAPAPGQAAANTAIIRKHLIQGWDSGRADEAISFCHSI